MMPKMTLGQKAQRLLTFLMGVRHADIAHTLAKHGFNQQELDQGWRLLRKVAGERLNATPHSSSRPEDIALLQHWSATWFPIAKAALIHHYPNANVVLFRNIQRSQGFEVVFAVETFLERLALLPENVRGLLQRRGLDDTTTQDARDLLLRISQVKSSQLSSCPRDKNAERAMWAFYKEWSSIARAVIANKTHLRTLGFQPRTRRKRRAPSS